MADQSDVQIAIQSIVATALYPNGSSQASAVGNMCRIYRGAPNAPALGIDVAAGIVNVSVTSLGTLKNTTRFPRVWRAVGPVCLSLNVTVNGQSASFSGICAVGQLVGVAADGVVFSYAVQAADTPATVASNLAALLRAAGWLVDYAGTAIGLPSAAKFDVRVVAGAGMLQEIKRQTQEFQISLWCPDPASRDAVGALIDQAMAVGQFIALADGSYARPIYVGSLDSDDVEDAGLYKRQLHYSAEFPTTISQMAPAMLFGVNEFSANGAMVAIINE